MTHGGFSTEGKIMLDDFNLYDIEQNRWLNVTVTMNGNEVKSDLNIKVGETKMKKLFWPSQVGRVSLISSW